MTNPNTGTALSGLAFTDALPAGLTATNGTTSLCGGSLVISGGNLLTFSGGTLASSANCVISTTVTGTTIGMKNNTTGAVTATGPVALTGVASNTATVTVSAPPTIVKSFAAANVALNGSVNTSFLVSNSNTTALSGIAFTDNLVAGLSATNGTTSICGGSMVITGTNLLTFTAGTLAGSANCTITVPVTGTVAGARNNTTGVISATESGNGVASNTATVTVLAPPTVAKVFGAVSIGAGSPTTLTLTLGNPAANVAAITGVQVDDFFPAGLSLQNTTFTFTPAVCATVTKTTGAASAAGDNSIRFTAASIAPGATCQVVANVTSSTPGNITNTTNAPTAAGPIALTGSTANASLTIYNLPLFTVVKTADKANANPGQVVTYTVLITNIGGGVSTNVVIDDVLSPYASFRYNAGAPFTFLDSFPASGLILGTPQYSNDNGGSWGYLPNPLTIYDGNITNWRIPMIGTMRAGGSYTLYYQIMVK